MTTRRCLLNVVAAVALVCVGSAQALDLEARLKWFTTASLLPEHDVQRRLQGTPALDHSFDARVMLRQKLGPLRLIADHSTTWLQGDGVALGQTALSSGVDVLDQTVRDDALRRFDLTWSLDDGRRHRLLHRFDRLALNWQSGNWDITLGRQAQSWGSGIVFQPMDLFTPFSPTAVDRDYKAGADLVSVRRLFNNGHDLQALHVARRDISGEATGSVTSSALKWHGYAGPVEFEVAAGRHFDEPVYAVSLRQPLGQALARLDVVASRDQRGGWVYSGVFNTDVTMVLAERTAYLFAEYFYNGWGVRRLPERAVDLPVDLTERLLRGELFNVMRNYLALGFNYEWHPLFNQSLTVIGNLHDGSSLVQIGLTYTPGDEQTLQFGWVEPLGRAGDEFGGLPLATDSLTTGGASRLYLRWVYHL